MIGAKKIAKKTAKKMMTWMSWSFVLENITKGILQAVGAVILYAFVIIWVINRSESLRAFLRSKLDPVLKKDAQSTQSIGAAF
jgi:hypothetical protein